MGWDGGKTNKKNLGSIFVYIFLEMSFFPFFLSFQWEGKIWAGSFLYRFGLARITVSLPFTFLLHFGVLPFTFTCR